MSDKTAKVRFMLKNDTAANWAVSTLVLLKGEIAIESDTGHFKFGDGVHTYSEIEKFGGTVVEMPNGEDGKGVLLIDGVRVTVYTLPTATTTALGGIKSAGTITGGLYNYDEVVVDSSTGIASVTRVSKAKELENEFTISIGGDVTGSTTTKGTGTASITVAMATQNVTANTDYTKVKVNDKGIVTFGTDKIELTDINNIGSAASLNGGTGAGNVPILDSDGKLVASVIPVVATNENIVVANQAARFALTTAQVQNGDFVSQSDTGALYMVVDSTKLNNETGYARVVNPSEVISVNGKTGVVDITTNDIDEGTGEDANLYFTNARATLAAATMSVTQFTDGSHVLFDTDTIIFDGGDASVAGGAGGGE